MKVDVIEASDEVESLVPAWNELAQRCGAKAWVFPFWTLGWWRTYRPSARLQVVTVFDHGELVALGPFCQVGPPGLRLVRFLGQLHQPNRVLTAPGREDLAVEVWRALRARRLTLDLHDLEVTEGSRLLVEDPSWSVFTAPADECIRIGLDGSADGYFDARPDQVRYLANKRRLAERDDYKITVVHADDPEEIEAVLPDLGVIATISQRDRFKPGELEVLAAGVLPGSVRAVAEAGRVHITLVRFNERPAAFDLDLLGGRTVQAHLKGYDTDLRRYGPGHLAGAESIRWAAEHGYLEFDLGVGAGEYKRRMSDDEYHTLRVIAAPNRVRLRAARAGLLLRRQVMARRRRLATIVEERKRSRAGAVRA
jgi:CelD/BcsL family acetyltransferase involved in cellulose biosynthesis